MAKEHTWPVSSYVITLYGSTGFGWIQLTHGARAVGYIYFEQNPTDSGRFGGSDPENPYIVMSQPIQNWQLILDVLRNEKPLYIRGYQATEGGPVSTFFGTSTEEPVGEGELQNHISPQS